MPIQTDSAPHSMPSFVTIGWGTPIACIAHGIVAPSIRRVGYSGHMHMPTKQEIRYQWEHGGPVMAWALIAACTAVWLVEVLLGFLSPTLQNWLIYRGMLAPATMLAEPWAIVTSMFLHAPNSILHILFNMIALYSVGPVLERLIGHWRFLGLYMISGLGGALGMMVWAVVAPWRPRLANGRLRGFRGVVRLVRRIAGGISPHRGGYPFDADMDGGELCAAVCGWRCGLAGACRWLCGGWLADMAADRRHPALARQKPCLAYAGVWLVGDRVGHRAYRGVQFCQSIWLDVALIPLWIPPGQCPIILSTCAQLCMKVHKTVDNLCG